MKRVLAILPLLLLAAPAGADVALVAAGKPAAVLVTPANPLPVVAYAASELAYHVRKATGVRLPIVSEDNLPAAPANRVWLGGTRAAAALRLPAADLGPEDCRLHVAGKNVTIFGSDTEGDPLGQDTRAGTLWGVYEIVERVLDAHWLWPGDVGTVVRKTNAVAIPDLSEIVKPTMLQRQVRPGLRRPDTAYPGFSEAGLAKYQRDQAVFLRRHRMGRSRPLKYGHAFTDWWETYGKEHPEWFQLLEGGKRGPTTPRSTFSMCVSDPNFHQEILKRWRQFKAENPGGATNVNGTENDIGGLCTCANCQAWDGPQVEEGADIYAGLRYRRVSDRYAKFWKALYDLAVKEDSNALVMGYAYINYYPQPSESIRLNRNILVGMCPWPGMWYPRSDREQEWLKVQWAGWARTGASVFYRPNTFLDGYTMPHVYAHQFADEFQHYARNNMVATDFDSLTGQWSTQGTTLYLLMRLHVRPDQPVEQVLGEYYSAFGPAAAEVKAYFDYWERYTTQNRRRLEDALAKQGASRYRQYVKAVPDAYPKECFAPAQEILDRAAKAAAGDATAAARVAFLQKGLTHAVLCREFAAAMAGTSANAAPMASRRALAKLAAFRKECEGDNIANYLWATGVEGRSYGVLPGGYGGEPLKAVAGQVAPLPAEAAPVPIRGQGTFVALLQAGQQFQARLESRKLGKNPDPARWRLFGPDDALVQEGQVEVGTAADLAIPVQAAGVYLLEVNSTGNILRVALRSDHAAAVGERLAMASAPVELHFLVPAGLAAFKITLQSQYPGETARLRVFDPAGAEAASGSTVDGPSFVAEVKVPAGQAGKPWSLRVEKADKGTFEDYTLVFDRAIPPFWAHTADGLVTPE